MTQFVKFASIEALREIVEEKEAIKFVWPEEGGFASKSGAWYFNKDHKEFQPLWVDMSTANLLVKIADALSNDNRPKFEAALAADRGSFCYWVDAGWDMVKSA